MSYAYKISLLHNFGSIQHHPGQNVPFWGIVFYSYPLAVRIQQKQIFYHRHSGINLHLRQTARRTGCGRCLGIRKVSTADRKAGGLPQLAADAGFSVVPPIWLERRTVLLSCRNALSLFHEPQNLNGKMDMSAGIEVGRRNMMQLPKDSLSSRSGP